MLPLVKVVFAPFQFFLLPGTIFALIVFIYLTVIKKDKAAGLVLLLGLIIIVDAYMNTGIYIPGLESGSIRYSELVLVLLLVREFKQAKTNKAENPLRSKLMVFFIIYLLFFFISVVKSDDVVMHFFRSYRDLGIAPFLIFYIASSGFKEQRDYKKFLVYLTILAIIITLGSYQEFLFDQIFIKTSWADGRFGSFFRNPNMLAAFYALLLPLLMLFIIETNNRFIKIFLLPILLFFIFGFLKTSTRAAFIALPISLLPMVFLKTKNISFSKKIIFMALILIIISIFSPRFFSGFANRIATIEDKEEVEQSRLLIWKGTMNLVSKHLLWGTGFGETTFMEEARVAFESGSLEIDTALAAYRAQMPHNSYLYILYFMGIFALIAFLSLMLIWFKASFSNITGASNSKLHFLNLGLFCSILGFCMASFFDFQIFVKTTTSCFWCLLGIGTSLYSHTRMSQNDPPCNG